MLRVLIVSDTHGQLDDAIEALAAGCDAVVHAGDIGCAAVLERLSGASRQLVAVRGNNDSEHRWPLPERACLRDIPEEATLRLPGGILQVVHGHQYPRARERHRRLRERYPHARAVVYGHSHRLVCDRGATPWVLNPGAAGRSRTFGGASCLLLSASDGGWRVERRRFPARQHRERRR